VKSARGGSPVSILSSGVGLGVYVPALLVQRQLRSRGVAADVETIEACYSPDCQRRHLAHQRACHQNFGLAALAQRMVRGVGDCLDPQRVDALFRRWSAEGRKDFIVWSGFWLPVLERYRQMSSAALGIDCCRIDADVSPSFRAHPGLAAGAVEIWLWNWREKRTLFELAVDDRPPVGFPDREHRLVLHGGGWGIGTYLDALAQLRNDAGGAGWGLDAIVQGCGEAAGGRPGDRYFAVDPDWRTWHRGSDGHRFPPLVDVQSGRPLGAGSDHALYELIRCSKAIVSKPGGGTLIDSLSSATPVVLLDPLGEAEACNGALWEHLGFGIPLSKWRQRAYAASVLEELHENLARRTRNGPDYPSHYVERLRQREAACISPSA